MRKSTGGSAMLITNNEIYKTYITELFRIWGYDICIFDKIDEALHFASSEKFDLKVLIVPLKHNGLTGENIVAVICGALGKAVPWICLKIGPTSCKMGNIHHKADSIIEDMFSPEELYSEVSRLFEKNISDE